ncbi:MAG: FMN-dependent NADH-azoreductase [Oleiphilus sp.]
MSILHIDTSAKLSTSNSRHLSAYLVDKIGESGLSSDTVIRRDLAAEHLPDISSEDLIALHSSSDEDRASLKKHFELSDTLITELTSSDTLVIGVAMYNFGIPAVLKQWIDYIARAGRTFKYTEKGPIGLSGVKHAYIVIASGGTQIGSPMDHVSPYLKTVMGFIGVETVHIIDASGSKGSTEKVIGEAKTQIDALFSE